MDLRDTQVTFKLKQQKLVYLKRQATKSLGSRPEEAVSLGTLHFHTASLVTHTKDHHVLQSASITRQTRGSSMPAPGAARQHSVCQHFTERKAEVKTDPAPSSALQWRSFLAWLKAFKTSPEGTSPADGPFCAAAPPLVHTAVSPTVPATGRKRQNHHYLLSYVLRTEQFLLLKYHHIKNALQV